MRGAVKATFSIVAADPERGEVGVAVQSKYFAVGAVVPWARAGVGAVATQAAGVAAYGPRILDELARGASPEGAIEAVLRDDPQRETRQLGVVAASGEAAAFTGSACIAWAGHRTGPGLAVQGNILAGEAVVTAMEGAYREVEGPMAERLTSALIGAQIAGGDTRGQQSAAVIVERAGAGAETREGIDRVVDLRVDDDVEPIVELGRLVEIQGRWDALREAAGFHAPGRYLDGAAVLEGALERYPDDAALLYDLACFRALAGQADAALEALELSLRLEPGYRIAALGDHDFASLRGDARFERLLPQRRQ